ncbi:MAG: LysR family transcriptional regulator [Lachnospiraceae bacterium]|nr:LysR family transcriptional regulator [Lachnospiraceae bacterium]
MNTRQLEYIVDVSDTLSFSESAKRLFVSQPSLSQYVKKIEKELGADLFVRTTPLKLTYEGEIFIRYAKKVLEEENFLQAEMSDISLNNIGMINVGAGPLNSANVLPLVISEFSKKNPKVEINVIEYAETELLPALDRGEMDILLTVVNPQLSENYRIEEMAREEYVLAIPAQMDPNKDTYLAKEGMRVKDFPIINVNECKNLPYIMQTNMMPAHIIFDNLCRKEGFIPTVKTRCKNIYTAIKLAATGLGACFIPSSVVDTVNYDLHFYRIEGNDSDRVVKLVYRKSMNLSPIQKEFVDLISKYYSGQL